LSVFEPKERGEGLGKSVILQPKSSISCITDSERSSIS